MVNASSKPRFAVTVFFVREKLLSLDVLKGYGRDAYSL